MVKLPRVAVLLSFAALLGACAEQPTGPEPAAVGLDGLALAKAAGKADKTAICHRPPGNPDNVQLIEVGGNAAADHYAHGDHPSYGGACYTFVAGAMNFDQAHDACVSGFGGDLASIHSAAEDAFVSTVVDPTGAGSITPWIGGVEPLGFTSGSGGVYHWTDGSAWDYAGWRGGEPNATGAPAGIQFWPNTNGPLSGWNDVPQSATLSGAVCKYAP